VQIFHIEKKANSAEKKIEPQATHQYKSKHELAGFDGKTFHLEYLVVVIIDFVKRL
jgi:hypothetical protein